MSFLLIIYPFICLSCKYLYFNFDLLIFLLCIVVCFENNVHLSIATFRKIYFYAVRFQLCIQLFNYLFNYDSNHSDGNDFKAVMPTHPHQAGVTCILTSSPACQNSCLFTHISILQVGSKV